jgi:hypothetical protein
MHIVISTSTYDLWENNIDIEVFRFIYHHSSTIQKPEHIYKLKRHDVLIIQAFRYVYGDNLELCNFAKIVFLPDCFQKFYLIERLQCYKYVYYPEEVHIQKDQYRRAEWEKIQRLPIIAEEKNRRMEIVYRILEKY